MSADEDASSSGAPGPLLDPVQVVATLPREVVDAAGALPADPVAYFALGDDHFMAPISMLRLSRARPEGIASAVMRMAQAARGDRSKRAPVSVAPLANGLWRVLDGNSTVCVATAAGWDSLPVRRGTAA